MLDNIPPITIADLDAAILRKKRNRWLQMFPDEGPLRRELYPKHCEFMKATKDYNECAFIAGNRTGKALRNDMPVLTPKGWKNISDLKIGSEVIGGDGNPCYVTGVFPQGQKETVEVFFDDGASVITCYEHLWKVRQGKERYKGKEWKIRSTEEILKRGAIKGDPQTVAEIPVTKSYISYGDIFMDPYVFGLLTGDGCYTDNNSQPRFSTADIELVNAISKFYIVKHSKGHGEYDYNISGGAVTHLKQIGVWGKRSWEKEIPRDYLWNSYPNRLAVLQGLMDTDGTAEKNGSAIFYSTSLALAENVVFLARSLGGKAKISPKQTHFYKDDQKITGRPSFAVRISIDVCPFRLKRKVDRWKKLSARGFERRFIDAVPRGISECTCITVDSVDHTFVTKDFIVTHNSETVVYAGTAFLTGIYPKWWEGRKFIKPVNIIAAGETAKLVRDSLQEKFIGPPNDIGTGMIPYDLIIERKSKPGIPDAVDTVRVKHISGGVSTIRFQSYDQGREAFQATSQDVIILDEEPPEDIYQECLTRLMTTKGLLMAAFTPLRGISKVVMSFMPDSFGENHG